MYSDLEADGDAELLALNKLLADADADALPRLLEPLVDADNEDEPLLLEDGAGVADGAVDGDAEVLAKRLCERLAL
jgi:hypothetical protein